MKKIDYEYLIPEPCNETWSEMKSVDGGRFCEHCQHQVVDISTMTERAFNAMVDVDDNVCGRFTFDASGQPLFQKEPPTQLQRQLEGVHRLVGIAAVSLVGLAACDSPKPLANSVEPTKIAQIDKTVRTGASRVQPKEKCAMPKPTRSKAALIYSRAVMDGHIKPTTLGGEIDELEQQQALQVRRIKGRIKRRKKSPTGMIVEPGAKKRK